MRPSPGAGYVPESKASAMRLYWDILMHTMPMMPRADASRLSRTCQTLLRAAAPALLSRRESEEVAISEASHLSSLSSFLSSDWHSNASRHLKCLTLAIHEKDAQTASLLADILAKATELRSLNLLEASVVLEGTSSFCDALLALTNLRTLRIGGETGYDYGRLGGMRAPLTAIEADFSAFEDPVDVIPVFAHLANSLRVLKLANVEFATDSCVYPHVVTLDIDSCDRADIGPIARCFPNLQDLTVSQVLFPDEAEGLREENRAAQLVHTWPSLRRVSGTVTDLYTLGLLCRVSHLKIISETIETEPECEKLAAVLADVRPTSLKVKIAAPAVALQSLAETLKPVQDCLTELWIEIDYKRYTDPSASLGKLFETLSAFPIRLLHIGLRWIHDTPSDDLDLRSVVHDAVQHIPALAFVTMACLPSLAQLEEELAGRSDGSRRSALPMAGLQKGPGAWDEYWDSAMLKPWWDADCDWYWST
ncbi:hypothetical protein PsYK624_041460 [Phanerochaete sordida]|uniref:F-box domain-containing protein n=1 Tax=Phanerochaete sordida TaxID=48140 RepID=A0A9P3LBH2_9APHY|nr:hypothetical protein PsYK624_041460 [Phanerochaete sordida]